MNCVANGSQESYGQNTLDEMSSNRLKLTSNLRVLHGKTGNWARERVATHSSCVDHWQSRNLGSTRPALVFCRGRKFA